MELNTIETKNQKQAVPDLNNHKNTKQFLLFLVVALVVAVGGYIGYRFFSIPTKTQPAVNTPASTSESVPVLSTTDNYNQQLVKTLSKINIPAISSATTLETSKLPLVLKDFIDKDAKELVLMEVSFVNGQTGYQIQYSVDKAVQTVAYTFSSLTNSSNGEEFWTLISSSRSSIATLIEKSGKKFEVRVIMNMVSENRTGVIILVKNK